jgi:hypothetical protein
LYMKTTRPCFRPGRLHLLRFDRWQHFLPTTETCWPSDRVTFPFWSLPRRLPIIWRGRTRSD